MEGIAIAKSGDKVRNSASPAELGMAKVCSDPLVLRVKRPY